MSRKKGIDKNFIDNISRWIKENKEFNKRIKSDITIDSNKKPDLGPLYSRLDKIL